MNKVTKKQDFLQMVHQLWCTDILDMSEYMDCLWVLMLRHDVRWKESMDVEDYLRSIQIGLDGAEEMFVYDVNVRSTVLFHNFHFYACKYMDFSIMEQSERRKA